MTRRKIRAGLFIAAGLLTAVAIVVTISVANNDRATGETALTQPVLGDGVDTLPDVNAPASDLGQALPAVNDTLSSNDGSDISGEPLLMDDEPAKPPLDTTVQDLPYLNELPGDSSDANQASLGIAAEQLASDADIEAASGSASSAPAHGGFGPVVVTLSELPSEDPDPDVLHVAPNPGYPNDVQR